jgi:hypothetical protein
MNRLFQPLCLLAAGLQVVCFGTANSHAATFAVGTTTGRVFVGEAVRVDDSNLWLRTEKAGISVERPIAWGSIALARNEAREFTPRELRSQVSQAANVVVEIDNPFAETSETTWGSNRAFEFRTASARQLSPEAEQQPEQSSTPPDAGLQDFIAAARAQNLQVCSISIDSYIAHWHRTVEATGIVLHVFPLDGFGAMIPVDGTLDVELVAGVPYGSRLGVPLPVIGRWTLRVTPDMFGPAGAVFKLPFQAVHPEFDLNVGPRGVVHATLNVPGNGSFEASDSMVRIRPYSEVRDQSQQLTGRRFFNVERVQRWGK